MPWPGAQGDTRRTFHRTLLGWSGLVLSGPSGAVSGTGPDAARERLREAWQAMQRPNAAIPRGVPDNRGWKWKPQTMMGVEPYGWAIPKWYPGVRHAEWPNVTLWFTLYESTEISRSANAAVEIGGLELWALRASAPEWVLLQQAERPTWFHRYRDDGFAIGKDLRLSGLPRDSGVAFEMTEGHLVHGGLPIVALPWRDGRADLRALAGSIRHRLVKLDPDGVDDRSLARFTVSSGVDFWPQRGLALGAPYNPASGTGPFVRVREAWGIAPYLALKAGDRIDDILRIAPPAFGFWR